MVQTLKTKSVTFDPSDLASDAAKSSDPPYFHRQPATVKFDFDQGLPDRHTYPKELLTKLAAEAIEEIDALEYCLRMDYTDMSLGDAGLRKEIAKYIERRDGKPHDPDGLMVTHGSAHGVALVSNGFLSRGDAVFVEAATFPFALRYFGATGAQIIPVPLDDHGLNIDALDKKIREARAKGLNPKLVYTMATHQLPTGTVLPLERRKALLVLARAHDLMILEDNIYHPYGEGRKVPTLLSLDTEGRVLQSDSFAKSVAPAVRIGWIAGYPSAIVALAKVRQDLGVSIWLQKMMRLYLERGFHEKHLDEMLPYYQAKREVARDALVTYCAPDITFHQPEGGWYYWLKLSDRVDWEKVKDECFRRGIAMRPGEMFLGVDAGAKHMRLAIGHVSHAEIRDGIRELGEAVRASLS